MGGPMTGVALHSTEVPVMKGTSGVIVFPWKKSSSMILRHVSDVVVVSMPARPI